MPWLVAWPANLVGTHKLSRRVTLISAPGGSTSPSAITSGTPFVPSSSATHHQRHSLVDRLGIFNTWTIFDRPPLLSGAVFQADPSRLQILVSDAAGDDGMGYYFGALGSDEPEYRVAPWDNRYRFDSSHAGELSAIDHFLHRTSISNCLILWGTDSENGMHSVISGVCKAVDGLTLLESSLATCNARQNVLLAFSWLCSVSTTTWLTSYPTFLTFTGLRSPDASRHPHPSPPRYPSFRPCSRQSLPPRVHGPRLASSSSCSFRGVSGPPSLSSVRTIRSPVPDSFRAHDGGQQRQVPVLGVGCGRSQQS